MIQLVSMYQRSMEVAVCWKQRLRMTSEPGRYQNEGPSEGNLN